MPRKIPTDRALLRTAYKSMTGKPLQEIVHKPSEPLYSAYLVWWYALPNHGRRLTREQFFATISEVQEETSP